MTYNTLALGAAVTTQFLLARHFGASLREGAVYCAVSSITTAVAFKWFNGIQESHNKELEPNYLSVDHKQKFEQFIKDQAPRNLTIAYLASYVLGWVAGSLASAINDYPNFKPFHMGATFVMSAAAFGVHSLVLLATKEFARAAMPISGKWNSEIKLYSS